MNITKQSTDRLNDNIFQLQKSTQCQTRRHHYGPKQHCDCPKQSRHHGNSQYVQVNIKGESIKCSISINWCRKSWCLVILTQSSSQWRRFFYRPRTFIVGTFDHVGTTRKILIIKYSCLIIWRTTLSFKTCLYCWLCFGRTKQIWIYKTLMNCTLNEHRTSVGLDFATYWAFYTHV